MKLDEIALEDGLGGEIRGRLAWKKSHRDGRERERGVNRRRENGSSIGGPHGWMSE